MFKATSMSQRISFGVDEPVERGLILLTRVITESLEIARASVRRTSTCGIAFFSCLSSFIRIEFYGMSISCFLGDISWIENKQDFESSLKLNTNPFHVFCEIFLRLENIIVFKIHWVWYTNTFPFDDCQEFMKCATKMHLQTALDPIFNLFRFLDFL